MTLVWARMLDAIDSQGAAALVSLVAVQGSAPREAGARMVVRPDGGFWGTVGGGQLEWRLLGEARAGLEAGRGPTRVGDWPLGPNLGQCCGGRVRSWIEIFDRRDRAEIASLAERETTGPFERDAWLVLGGRVARTAPEAVDAAPRDGAPLIRERFGDDRTPVLLFGAGHVGRALALAMAPLPFRLRWIDPRPDAFPPHTPSNAEISVLAQPADAIAEAPSGALVMVMTHSHPLDLAVMAAALARADLGPVGLIGSSTKRARFVSQLRQTGLSGDDLQRLVCPIGIAGVSGKEPAVIAAATAAQLLQWREARDAARQSSTRAAASFRPRRISGERG